MRTQDCSSSPGTAIHPGLLLYTADRLPLLDYTIDASLCRHTVG